MSTAKRKIAPNYDPYRVLGIEVGSSDGAIDKAFKKLALKWHPDKNPNNKDEAQKHFIEIYKAYEFLKDKVQKTEFDSAAVAKKKRAEYESHRKATSSTKRQHFLEKLHAKEKAHETKEAPAKSTKRSADEEALLRQFRREGAQLLKRMAEEQAAAEQEARLKEHERRQREHAEAATKHHPHANLYNMSLDDLDELEKQILNP